MKNRKLLLIVSLVLAMTMSLGGTLAYLQDSDSDVNTMTLGSVKIEQHEYQRVQNADGTYKTDTIDGVKSYVLEGFEQDKPLLPIVGDPNEPGNSPAYKGWDTTAIVRMTQVDSYGGMDVFAGKNAVDKFVTVENTGVSPAYVRTYVAIEVGSTENKNPHANDKKLVMTSSRSTTDETKAGTETPWLLNDIGLVTINGNNYEVHEYIYAGAQLSDSTYRHKDGKLPGGDTTYPSLCQVYVKHNATNEDLEALDGNKNGKLDILVLSQAVQADGFEATAEKSAAQVALEAGFGVANAENVAKWFGDEDNTNAIPVGVATADELVEALETGKNVVLNDDIKIDPANMSNAYGTTGINVKNGQTIDGNGNTLDIKGAGGTWDSGINTTGGLIKNLTVTGSFRGIFINHNSTHSEPVVLENVTIDGTTYTISCDQGMNQNFEAYNSTFNGWTSFAATIGTAKFVDCNFGEGNGYAYCRPYAPTEFVGCEFETGYKIDARAACTFENCTLNGVPLTAENLTTLVTSNSANASVK